MRGREFELAIMCALRALGVASPARVAEFLGLPRRRVKDKMLRMAKKGLIKRREGVYGILDPEPPRFLYRPGSTMAQVLEFLGKHGVIGPKDVPGRKAVLWRLWHKGLIVKSRTKPVIFALTREQLVRAIIERIDGHDVLAKIQTRPVAAVELDPGERKKAEILAKEGIVLRCRVGGMWIYHAGAPGWQLQLAAQKARSMIIDANERGRQTEARVIRWLRGYFRRVKKMSDFDAVIKLPLGLHVLVEIKNKKRIRLTDVQEFLRKADRFDPYAIKMLISVDSYIPETVRDFCNKNRIKILEWDD